MKNVTFRIARGLVSNLRLTLTGVTFDFNGQVVAFESAYIPDWLKNGAFVEVNAPEGRITLVQE